jgi:hypothetical protein
MPSETPQSRRDILITEPHAGRTVIAAGFTERKDEVRLAKFQGEEEGKGRAVFFSVSVNDIVAGWSLHVFSRYTVIAQGLS